MARGARPALKVEGERSKEKRRNDEGWSFGGKGLPSGHEALMGKGGESEERFGKAVQGACLLENNNN